MNPAWKTCKLGNVCTTICSGGTPSALKSEYYEGGTIPWLNTSEIDFGPISSTQRYITESGLAHSAAKWIPKHTVIVAMYGATAGRVAYTECPITTNQACCNLVVDPSVAHYKYVYYSLVKQYNYVKSLANGGAQQNLNAEKIKNLPLVLPPLADQERIAGVLGAYDELIAVNERRMALLEEAAHRLWRDRFVTHADPAWPSRPLRDFCTSIQSGGTPSRGEVAFWTGGTIDWFKTKELQDSWLLSSEEKITKRGVQHSSARLYPAGTILMAIYASPTLGRLGILSHEATCNQAALGFIVDKTKTSRWWLFHTLLEERERFNQVARGAGQQNISSEIVKDWAVRTPPTSVMHEFERIVDPYWRALLVLSRENASLRAGRDGLLPRLLRGEA